MTVNHSSWAFNHISSINSTFASAPQLDPHISLERPHTKVPEMPRKVSKRRHDDDDSEFICRKRPYEDKMSNYLMKLDISGEETSNNGPRIEEVDSWFPVEQGSSDMFDEGPMPYVEEPSTSSDNNDLDSPNDEPSEFKLSEELKSYIENCKKETGIIKPMLRTGKELLVWEPTGLKAFYDPSMYGRIKEMEENDDPPNYVESHEDYHYITLPEDASTDRTTDSPATMTSSPLSFTGDANDHIAHYQDEEFIDLTTIPEEEERMDLG